MKLPERRPHGSWLVSIALHIVLGAALLFVLSIPYPIDQWLKAHQESKPVAEHVTYMSVAPRGATVPQQSGGDNAPVRTQLRSQSLIAPTAVPTTLPTAPASPAPPSGNGPLVGAGGAGEGVTPSYGDPRVWAPSGPLYYAPKSSAERLDSALTDRVLAHNDSMALYNSGRAPADWTFEKGGRKYGIDQQKIYLGKLALPTALLALLPLNVQGNPARYQNDRMKGEQRAEILYNAQRAMDNDDFKDAVKRIRQRKDREHKEELEARQAQEQAQHDQAPDSPAPDQAPLPSPPADQPAQIP